MFLKRTLLLLLVRRLLLLSLLQCNHEEVGHLGAAARPAPVLKKRAMCLCPIPCRSSWIQREMSEGREMLR